mmetsp:Transcript_40868/g.46902  ORF Transcript_40868/g.46902 Transcript_40868/m.46902 type:complete len:115 (+) Transcript_40868:1006-1350(+)
MAQNIGNEIISDVLEFVSMKIKEGCTWKDKYTGLLALGAILEGPSQENIKTVLTPAVVKLLELFDDECRKVRETVAWFFSKIAQNHADLIGTQDLFPEVYERVLKGLKDETRVA